MEFDYVIVGAGSSGCVVANRLSEDPDVTVCLLEAGPPDRSPFIHIPLGVIRAMMDPKINWLYWSAKQKEAGNRRAFMPRGKTLGGSSSINGMVYIRGHRRDYDEWAEAGNPGWSWADVKPYFLKSENNEQFAGDGHHGAGGPLNVTFVPDPSPANKVFVEAAESLQYRHNPDFNGEVQDGFGLHQVTQKNGQRHSTAAAFLKPIQGRANLTVMTDSPAARVVIENGRARGVAIASKSGEKIVTARKEVILSAGSITSPAILMRSGVGDPDELKRHGIETVRALPGVGKNLQDHASVLARAICKRGGTYGITVQELPKLAWSVFDYLLRRRGMFASNMVEGGGFAKTDPALDRPDIQYVFLPGHKPPPPKPVGYGYGYQVISVLLRPKSRGTVKLSSAKPDATPVIDPRFFSEPEDLDVLMRGYKEARRILNAGPFEAFEPTEVVPGPDIQTDDQLREHIRNNSATIFHPVGTCKMGRDDMAVVDARLRVHGIEGLRVVDASIMPTIVGGNTNAPCIMIGEKAADMIKEDAREVRAAA